MRKVYEVAGFKFAVEMPDNAAEWSELAHYEPFLSEDSGTMVFVA